MVQGSPSRNLLTWGPLMCVNRWPMACRLHVHNAVKYPDHIKGGTVRKLGLISSKSNALCD